MNRTCLIGRLTKDPILTTTRGGYKMARFTLAVDRVRRKGTDFIDIQAWRKMADIVEKYLGHGDLVGIDGYLQVSTYKTASGESRKSEVVVVEGIDFCSLAKNQRGEPLPTGRIDDPESGDVAEGEINPDDDLPF